MADFTKYGDKTPRVVVYKSESHKLHQAFPVKVGDKIYSGNPIVINPDGTISPFGATSTMSTYIGIAMTDNMNPAYKENNSSGPVEVTVAVIGYIILNGVSKGVLKAGAVKPTGAYDATKRFTEYDQVVVSSTDPVHFIALNETTAAGELVQILAI